MAKLETERLALRPISEKDFADLRALYADPEVMRYINFGKPLTRHQARQRLKRMLNHWQEHGFGIWAVRLKRGGDFVGRCGIQIRQDQADAELAYTLRQSYWGQGLATESAKAAVAHGFLALDLSRIVAHADVDNFASQKVMIKLGMKYQGRTAYEEHDAVEYSLERKDWLALADAACKKETTAMPGA